MVGQFMTLFGYSSDHRALSSQKARLKRIRHRVTPEVANLESRLCLSTAASSLGVDRVAHLAIVSEKSAHHVTVPSAKTKLLQVVYVKPGGGLGTKAGKSEARPLGSINKALKLVQPGGTIVLAPGVYNENVVVSLKSNITIIGAANQSSVLSPSSGDALKIALSNNISIQNVWFRSSGSQGRGIAIMGSSVNVANIKTDGTQGDGVVEVGYQGRGSTLNAYASQFNGVRTGDGLHLEGGSSATIDRSTFNANGTASNVTQASNGLVLEGDASAHITNSQFLSNTNGGLVGLENSYAVVQTSTFASNVKGNGALFLNSSSADLRNNLFSSNGVTPGPSTGLNGVEFLNGFTGNAFIASNTFQSNTGNGLYVGGGTNTMQILGNLFDNNFVGITMDTASGSSINATVQGNTIRIPAGASSSDVGILAVGRGLTATIGGAGGLQNTLQNYVQGTFIYEAAGDGNTSAGAPNLTILTNTYTLSNGRNVSQSYAVHTV